VNKDCHISAICIRCTATRKHEDDGADAAGGTGIILVFTCIPGYQMSPMQLVIFTRMWRAIQTKRNVH